MAVHSVVFSSVLKQNNPCDSSNWDKINEFISSKSVDYDGKRVNGVTAMSSCKILSKQRLFNWGNGSPMEAIQRGSMLTLQTKYINV